MFRWLKDKTLAFLRWNKRQLFAFLYGFSLPFRGIAFLFRHPRLLLFAIPPALITSALLLLTSALVLGYTDELLGLLWTRPDTDAWYVTFLLLPLWYLLYFLVTLILIVLSVVLSYLASIPIAGPFAELLAEKVEAAQTGFEAPFHWKILAQNVLISLLHVGLFTAIQLAIFALLTAIGFIPVAGQIISLCCSFITSPLLVGFAPFDYPMTVRIWRFDDKMRFMLRNFPLFYGFSLAAFFMLYIPFINLAFLPCCVIGATLALLRLEAEDPELVKLDRRKATLSTLNLAPNAHAEPTQHPPTPPQDALDDAPQAATDDLQAELTAADEIVADLQRRSE